MPWKGSGSDTAFSRIDAALARIEAALARPRSHDAEANLPPAMQHLRSAVADSLQSLDGLIAEHQP